MSLLDTVKSLLGLEDTSAHSRRQDDVAVTVEHEPTTDTTPTTASEDAVKGTETSDSAGESTAESASVQTAVTEHTEADTGESVDVIKGVGPTYATQLADAGIETVAQLADADPEALAEMTDISEKRLTRWVERAKHR